ncbi:hypothetical protein QTJ16_004327 [Diplocarpon rosae]|uniref:ERF1 methyltransferase catalytic subunit MTQ2 n=1 Tax=Diplocarpon rosae TaxID=946125 RepID=A0AAD9SYP6_9HELO|nr:hypothetical protein QTJ16_004327 [Diplocarpon rosae]PBP26971.1 putative N(5)-glutamine methyltransferase MTQ2 [Diplocarpon rosae]
MLPTPSTSHVSFERVYEPAEDSYLLLDTLSSDSEKAFLHERFTRNFASPLVVEIGTGSGVVISFLHAHADAILGHSNILTLGVDVNRFACKATEQTIVVAEKDQAMQGVSCGFYLGNVLGDLALSLKPGEVDILVFNPPYVPTTELPGLPEGLGLEDTSSYADDSHLLSLSYAGGSDGMETTNRLLQSLDLILDKQRGCAYILLCAQNQPEKVKQKIQDWGSEWAVDTVGTSGMKAGWEKLQIVRIWRTPHGN